MLVLGEKYTFTKLELERLQKKFNSIEMLRYKDEDALSVIAEIEENLKREKFSLIVLNTKAKVDDEIIKYLTNLKFQVENSKFKIISIEHFLEEYLHKCYIPEDNTDLHYLDEIKGYTYPQKFQKGIIDLVAVICLFPILLITKYITHKKMQKESPGSLYFKQSRVGVNNVDFQCVKFRSMHEHDTNSDVRTAIKDDDRTYPWGQTLRKTRLDEVPQIFNILKGEAHLIGPRAEWNKLTLEYEKEIPYYNQRHIVAPGITGWAQVMFVEGRSKDDTRQKLMYDLYYIKYWSLLLEFKVIWKTVLVVLGKKGI
jgi:lipopolysaccharide/colanic/teichoic acid biosynthesis glycosyltransferase